MILGVYGYHNTGKTGLVEGLIRELTLKGLRIASVKNIPREFSIDSEGKDTWRHREAGAGAVAASSLNETAFIFNRNMKLDEIFGRLGGYDVILVEGCKKADIPKIAVGNIKEEENTVLKYEDNLDEIIEYIMKGVKMEGKKKKRDIKVEINGKNIPLNRFLQEMFTNTIYGMVSSLHGVRDITEINIKVKKD
ncbi:MAG: molybdopterin-guanine dinucleotide biosynthesis protein B [Candidatus Altiarchaeota archaeon]|nr:molybdopterin-guanine dinucleotide biosynthesis protein B [Candidatus Altiarchaeota archaeon]